MFVSCDTLVWCWVKMWNILLWGVVYDKLGGVSISLPIYIYIYKYKGKVYWENRGWISQTHYSFKAREQTLYAFFDSDVKKRKGIFTNKGIIV